MKSRNVSRRPSSRDQKRRLFFGSATKPGRSPFAQRGLRFEQLEDRRVLAVDIEIFGSDLSDTLIVTATGPDTGSYSLNGGPAVPFSEATSFTFNGFGGNDLLRINNPAGDLFAPVSGIFYDGGGQPGDGLENLGGSATGGSYAPGNAVDAGVIVHTRPGATQTITFNGLAPSTDTVAEATFTINGTPADNAINYSQGSVATNGLVSVDNFETIEFSNKTNLVLNGAAGSDTINLHYNNTTNPAGLTGTITVNGADPSGSDSLILNGIDGVLDNLRYLPTSVGAGTVINDNAPQPNVLFTGIEHLTEVVQQTDGDGVRVDGTLGNDATEFFHGLTSDSGLFVGTMDHTNSTGVGPFAMTPMSYSGIFPLGNDSDVNFFGAGGTDTLVFNGTANDDNIVISGGEAGGTEFRNTLNGIVVARLEVFNIASGLVRALAGNDTINVSVPAGPAAATLRVEGGDSDSSTDTLNYTAPAGAATTIDLGTSTITSVTPAGNPVTFSGIEHLNETSSGAGSTLTINGTASQDSLAYTPTGATAGTVTVAGAQPVINFTGVGSTFRLDPLTGIDSVTVNGNAASNQITLTGVLGAPTLQIDALKTVTLVTANTEALVVGAGLGNDNLTVNSTAAPVLIPLTYDGSSGADSLTLTGGTASSDVYTPGPNPGSGSSVIAFTSGGGGTQTVNFQNLEPVFDNVSATTATVNGTNADNAINYTQGPGGGIFVGNTGLVTVDNQESYEFNNKTNLVINGAAGSDTINLHYNNTTNPTGLTGTISVNGGDPTASDTLVVNGIDGVLDNLRYRPTSVGAGTVINDDEPQPNVLFTGIEHLTEVVQQADGDSVRVDGTTGNDAIEFFHGLTSDSGLFVGTMDQNNATGVGPFTMTPMSYSGVFPLGNDADVNFFGAGGADTLVFNGTTNDDNFVISTGEAGGTQFQNTLNGIVVARLEVFNIASGLVRGLEGNDTINVSVPAGPAAAILRVEGGDSDQSTDVLNYTAPVGSATTIDIGTSTITSVTPAGNPMTYSGIERINEISSGAGSTLTVNGTAGDDNFQVQPTAAGAGTFTRQGFGGSPQFTYSGVGGTVTFSDVAGGFDILTILGDEGVDTVTSGAATVTRAGGTITVGAGLDRLDVYTFGGNDTVTLTTFSALTTVIDAGDGDDVLIGSPNPDLIFGGTGNDILVGGAGSDTQYGEDGNDIFGNATLTPDGVADDAGVDFNFGGDGFDNFVWEPGDGADVNNGGNDGADIFRFFGNAAANVFTLQSGGTATHFNALIGAVTIDNHGIEDVIVDGQGGADSFTINDLYATEVVSINLNLGAADAAAVDPVVINGRNINDNVLISTPSAGALRVQGLRYSVNITNAEATDTLRVNGNDGDDVITATAGTSSVIALTLSGGAGNDILDASATTVTGVTLEGDAGDDTLFGGSGNDTMRGEAVAPFGNDTFVGNGGTDAVGTGGVVLGDRILVPGTPGNDVMNLALNAAGHLLVTINSVTTTYTNFTGGPIASSGVDLIAVTGGSGNDSVTIDSTLGALTIPVEYDGGSGSDSLTLTGGVATSDVYSVGPNPGQGTSTIVIGAVTQLVTFSNLEPVIDLVGGPLVVNANNANNAINYTQGTVAANGLVSIDIHETIEFSNKTTLTINALAGSDTINLNNPTTPTGLTGITVNGGDPTASDTVIVNGTTATNTISVTGFTRDGATVTAAQPVPVTVATAEHLTIVGQGGDDTLTVTSPDDGAEITFSPGATADAGSIAQFGFDAGTSLLPLNYTTLGGGGSLTFDVDGGGRESGLDIRGTDNDDQFDVTATATGTVQIVKATFAIDVTLPINTTGVVFLRLLGQNGDDIFNIPGNHPIPLGIDIQGSDPSASDVLNFTGSGVGAVAANLGAQTVTEAGFGSVSFTGVETLNVSANNTLGVTATGDDDDVTVTVFSATSGRIENGISLAQLGAPPQSVISPVVNYSNITGALLVDLAGGEDTLAVVGNALSQTINVNAFTAPVVVPLYGAVPASTVQVDDGNNLSIEGTVTFSNTESVQVAGLQGNDTFNVVPGPTPVFVDGGDPIGISGGDLINPIANGNPVLFEAGPESDEGGFVFGGVTERISFDHIEAVGEIVGPSSVIILGTNGDDDITVIARDSSTHALADGIRDFTVSVNGGPDVLYIDVGGVAPTIGQLHIDGLAGDDDIIIRAPAPNDAGWSMLVEVAGGSPSSGAPNEGDRLVVETPGTDTVFFTPTSVDTGIIDLDTNGNAAVQVIGETRIVIGAIVNADPPINYNSTQPPGIELFEYDGEGGNDTFTVVGTAGADTIVHTPGSGTDEGTLRVNNFLGVTYQNLGSTATLTVDGSGGTDSLVYDGTDLDDTFTVAALTGAVTLANSHGTPVVLSQTGVENLVLNGFDGDDIFNIAGNHPFIALTASGGNPSASDIVNFNGTGTSAITVNLGASTVQQAGFGAVTLSGVEILNANAAAASANFVATAGDDTVDVTPTGLDSVTIRLTASSPSIGSTPVTNLSNVGATMTVDGGGGFNGLVFHGTDSPDTFNLDRGAQTLEEVGRQIVTTTNSFFSWTIEGESSGFSPDVFNINEPGSVSVVQIIIHASPLVGDILNYSTTFNQTYTPGSTRDSGEFNFGGGIILSVSFTGIETANVTYSTLATVATVNAGSGTNQITAVGTGAAAVTTTIDNNTVVNWSGLTTLNLNGQAGDDTFSVTPGTFTGAGGINVDGGDPTASDTVIVNGTAGTDAINYSPTSADGGTVQVNALALVTLQTVEHLTINGLGGNDSLTFTTPAGIDIVTVTPGALADQGYISARRSLGAGGGDLLPLTFTTIGTSGSLSFADAGAIREDQLTINGTEASNLFGVTAAGQVDLETLANNATIAALVLVSTPGVDRLTLAGLGGDDTFIVPGNHPFTNGILVDGGSPSASDTLNFTGAGAAVTVDLAASTVTETGFGAVAYTGVEVLNVDAGAGAILVSGTTGPDSISVTPTGATTATVTATGVNTTINTTNAGTLTINPGTGSDNVSVIGTQNGETITVTAVLVTVGALKPVTYASTENLRVIALAGNDTIDVTPSATTTIFVDGGDPIGSTPGDRIVLHPAGPFVVEPGPENDEGGLNTAGVQRVSWDHIESITVVGPGPGPAIPGLILGTNGDDDITIIARDASTHLGADGVQDFTISVNTGPEILFLNMPVFLVDALAGDDDIVVREPAPNNAVWNVQLFISGGTPAAPTGDQGDVVELETPGTQTVIFTPNPAAFVIPGLLPGLTLTVPAPSGIDTAILNDTTNASIISITPFTVSLAGIPIYNSSPGGAEQIVYQGLAGGDNLTINGTASNDTTTLNPTGQGSGSFRSGLSPTFDFTGATVLTVNPGTGGFDNVIINGTQGPDVVTSTATTITLGGTVTLGAGMDRLDLNTLGGNDSITLALAVTGLAKFIDAGAGNDTVNLTAVAVDPADPTIFGGDGDDLLIGSPNPDLIFGGRGNDIIIGGGGADVEYGEDGDDLFGDQLLGVGGISNLAADDAGNDQLFGGTGSDRFVWDPGDGSDTIEGGAGESDQMIFFGNVGAETFGFTQVGTRLSFTRSVGAITIDAAGIDQVTLQTGGGADIININDITQTDVRSIDVNLANADGTADGAVDTTTVFGREVADSVAILAPSAGLLAITGLKYDINIRNAAAANDVFTFNAVGGNDTVVTADDLSAQFTTANFTVNGGLGNDTISGYGTLNGNEGDDTLVGGSLANVISGGAGNDTVNGGGGDDILNGNDGNDTFIGGIGNDTIDGGNDYDTILVLGTPSNDLITANQTADTSVTYTVTPTVGTASVETDTLVLAGGVRTVEELRILADAGDDNILVTAVDTLGIDAAVNSLIFNVDGGSATTRDRLSVQDNGTGDLVLYRRGTTDDAGSVTVGPGNAEPLETVFFNVERVDPVAGAGGAIRVFKHDSLEWNDDVANATFLGADETINVDPNIDPGALIVPGFATVPADNDFFRVVAEKTGTLDFQVYFSQLATVPSGRPGLPNAGNLEIELYDVDGTLIVDGVAGGITPEFGLNDATDNERIRIPAVAGQTYYLRVFPDGTAINTYSITTINTAAPVPFDIELLDTPINTATNSVNGTPVGPTAGLNSDTGRSRFDDITFDNDPTILIRVPHVVQVLGVSFLDDIPANGSGAPGSPPDETILIPFVTSTLTNAPSAGFRVAVFVTENNTTDAVLAGYAQPIVGRPGVFTFTFANDALTPDGSYFISASVEMIDPTLPEQNQGFGELAESLEAIIDTTLPPASFGSPGLGNDGLILSDECPTPLINLTNIARPTFWGRAEADTVINLYLDSNANGLFDPATDVFLGQTVATPFDGGDQYPNGYWEIESRLSLNDPSVIVPLGVLPFDGPRTLFITAEDVAGNITGSPTAVVATTLQIVIDTQGPQVTNVQIAGSPGYNLFGLKPDNASQGPTPLVNSLIISFQDLPPRVAGTLYNALLDGTVVPGNFHLIGDYNGIIPISNIILVNNPPVAGLPATATVELVFRTPGPDGIFNTTDDVGKPLPDDRFTLTVEDAVTDPLCNELNGESNANEPNGSPNFPSGDEHNGGDFVARFTVDSRAEVGTWGAGAAWIDTNGNTTFDQNNLDYVNRDITYYMGYTSDNLFAGNFVKAAGGVADGFDKLAAYGKVGGSWRFLVDVDNDGVITPGVDIAVVDPASINGVPVAGNFDGNAANGDEVGIFTGTTWYFDTNHDFKVELGSALPWGVNGYPVVGNFDGVAGDDLATYRDNTFFLDYGRNGSINATFRFGFPTPNNRPVSADVDRDGNDDLGLFVPNRAGVSPHEDAEWYILVSGGAPISSRIHADPIDGVPVIDFKPVPFGNDLYIQYGDEFGLPILGNFDPPVAPGGSTSVNVPSSNPNNPLDVNNDGFVTPIDALLVINEINVHGSHALDTSGFHTAPFFDTDKDNAVSPHDVLLIINKLNAPVGSPGGEGEAPAAAHDAVFSQLGGTNSPAVSDSTADAGILSLLADDQLRAKRSRQAE